MAVLKDLVVIGPARVTGPSYANSFVKAGGTSSQFLKADGSVDSNSYALATSIPTVNNATLTIAASGLTLSTDPTFTANASAAKTITITHPTATAYSSGFYKVTVNGTGHVTAATAVTASDITSLVTIPSFAALGSSTKPVYLSAADTFSQCNTYAGGTAVTLNGTSKSASTASFYAPTSVGASGEFLKSNGSGAPTWANVINTDYVLVNTAKPTVAALKLTSATPYARAANSLVEVYIPETITATGTFTFSTNHTVPITGGSLYCNGSNTDAPHSGYYHGFLNELNTLYLYDNGFLPAKGFIVPGTGVGYLKSDGTIDTSTPGGGGGANYYPTAVTWVSGASAGPKPKLTMSGVSDITGDAVPSASSTASGIVTNKGQTFGGVKTFAASPKLSTNIITTSGGYSQTFPNASGTVVNGTGTSGYIAKWNGTNSITNGPQFGSSTSTFLRNDGSWAAPAGGGSQAMSTAVAQYNSSASTTGKAIYTATVSNVQRNAIFIYIDSTEYAAHFNATTQLWIDLTAPITADNYVFIKNTSGHTLNFTSTNISSGGTVPDYILYPEDNNGDNPLDDNGIIDMRTTLIGITFLDNPIISPSPIAVVTFGGRFNEAYPNNTAS